MKRRSIAVRSVPGLLSGRGIREEDIRATSRSPLPLTIEDTGSFATISQMTVPYPARHHRRDALQHGAPEVDPPHPAQTTTRAALEGTTRRLDRITQRSLQMTSGTSGTASGEAK
jgi:hypothetical protein